MGRRMLMYGALAGMAIIGTTLVALALFGSEQIATEWFGYLVMLLALSLIFVGIKRYRDEALGGVIRFRTAFGLGLGITVVASVIYVGAWEINMAVDDDDFIDSYAASVIADREAEGLEGEALQTEIEEMDRLRERYANPFFRLAITFLEIFPVGLLITLASAGLLRNPEVMPARG
jgi:hypothetical protein